RQDLERLHALLNVIERLTALGLERRRWARTRHRSEFGGDERCARRRKRLQSRGDVDAMTEQIVCRGHDNVTDMSADADRRFASGAAIENVLNGAERRASRRELEHKAVAGR